MAEAVLGEGSDNFLFQSLKGFQRFCGSNVSISQCEIILCFNP